MENTVRPSFVYKLSQTFVYNLKHAACLANEITGNILAVFTNWTDLQYITIWY